MGANSNNNRKYINLSNDTILSVDNFSSLNYNGEFNTKLCEIIDTFSAMLRFCQRELYRTFTDTEINLMSHIFFNKTYTPNINPKIYFNDVISESIMFENTSEEFKIDEDSFNKKVNSLTSFQCYFLMQLISIYHDNKEKLSEEAYFTKCFGFLIKKEGE